MKKTLRILSLEDDPEDFEIVNRALSKGGLSVAMKRVDNRASYLTALRTYKPDVILSDHSLPKFDSTEALRICRTKHAQIPFILVTGAVSDEFAVNIIKLGADDYVLKSNLTRLTSAILNAVKQHKTEQARLKGIAELAVRNDELTKINNELDSFVYSVSHNLRAPLLSILGLVQLVKLEEKTQDRSMYYTMMEDSVYKLDNTVKEILNYSRNARQELQIGPIDLKSLIDETLEKVKFMKGFDRLDIRVSINPQVAFHSDFYRVSVVLNNLISNAVKYSDPKKPKPFFTIDVEVCSNKARLLFRDNGIGIDNSLLPKIFDMFFRATTTNEGSGLGLYIVKGAIDKLQGEIKIESALGDGTAFSIEIPNRIPDSESDETLRIVSSRVRGHRTSPDPDQTQLRVA